MQKMEEGGKKQQETYQAGIDANLERLCEDVESKHAHKLACVVGEERSDRLANGER